MRRKQNEITETELIEEILQKSEVCRIAMVDDGIPYIVPMNYGYNDRKMYFHCAPEGRKIDILRKNNKVCFEIELHSEIVPHETDCEWGTKYRSVIGYGRIDFITNFEEKTKALDSIMQHYGKTSPNVFKEKQVEFVCVLQLTIEEITGKQLGKWE